MFRRLVLLIFIISTPLISGAQNLFPNPGFELFSLCPTYTSQIDRCSNWDSAVGTADFYHCGYYAPSTIGVYGVPRTGSGVVGLVCAAPSVFNPGQDWYGETFKGMLTQTLIPGARYRVTSHWLQPTTNLPPPSMNCFSLGFYFFKSIHPPNAPLRGCATFRPQVQIDPSLVPVSSYADFTIDFTADSCYDAVMIGIFCNDSTTTPTCLQVGETDYFDVDDISLTKIADPPLGFSGFTASEIEICENECLNFQDTSAIDRYYRTWYFEGADTPQSNDSSPTNICYADAGSYDVTLVTVYECGRDSIVKEDYIKVSAPPTAEIIADTSVVCFGVEKILESVSNNPVIWSNGESTPSILIRTPGLYIVKAENECGLATDSLTVEFEKCPCEVWLPNAFTPNSDSKNETFGAISDCILKLYKLSIYNRWGQEVYQSASLADNWDGRYNGQDAPEGIYVAKLQYEGYDEDRISEKEIRQILHLLR